MTRGLKIAPLSAPFDFSPDLPGSKSFANRCLILAALADRPTILRGVPDAEDVERLIGALDAMGFFIDRRHGHGVVTVGPRTRDVAAAELFCGDGGTTLRFLVALSASTAGEWTVVGSERLAERPHGALLAALRAAGVEMETTRGSLPLRIRGRSIDPGTVRIDASVSSQFVSAMMLVGASFPSGLAIEIDGALASASYVDLTIDLLSRFSVAAERRGRVVTVRGGGPKSPGEIEIESDWSAAGVWLAAERITRSRARMPRLDPNSTQGDRRLPEVLSMLEKDGDLEIDVGSIPDQVMNLAVYALMRRSKTELSGVRNLRVKESDRLAVLASGLTKVGGRIDVADDRLTIVGGQELMPAQLATAADHRMAMAFALLGLFLPGIEIDDRDCVKKSYPGFFADVERARRSRRAVAIVGMRLTGKSTLGALLAQRTATDFMDTDRLFETAHGEIGAFTDRFGWPAFRTIEERIVVESLLPQRVIAVGAGAIESKAVREALRRDAITLWSNESPATLLDRLTSSPRPALTSAGAAAELAEIAARREPLYREVANARILPGLSPAARLDAACAALEAFVRSEIGRPRNDGFEQLR